MAKPGHYDVVIYRGNLNQRVIHDSFVGGWGGALAWSRFRWLRVVTACRTCSILLRFHYDCEIFGGVLHFILINIAFAFLFGI